MTIDREQIRRDVNEFNAASFAERRSAEEIGLLDLATTFANHCLALLAELDQAESHTRNPMVLRALHLQAAEAASRGDDETLAALNQVLAAWERENDQ